MLMKDVAHSKEMKHLAKIVLYIILKNLFKNIIFTFANS